MLRRTWHGLWRPLGARPKTLQLFDRCVVQYSNVSFHSNSTCSIASFIAKRNPRHEPLTANGIVDVYSQRPFHSTITNFGKVGGNLPKQQKLGEVANMRGEIIHITSERFSYCSNTKAATSDSSLNTLHYNPTLDRVQQIVEDVAVKGKTKNFEEELDRGHSFTFQVQEPRTGLSLKCSKNLKVCGMYI